MYNQYNPYMNYGNYSQQPTYQPVQPQQVILPKQNNLNGKMIESIDMAKTIETPLDGNSIYLPLLDRSAIVVKRLTSNGTSELVVYKPIEEKIEKTTPITLEELKQSIEELKQRNNDEIMGAIEELRKDLKKKSDK